jgi:hypothetical protein
LFNLTKIIIFGAARSGTDYLAKLLCQHFDLNYIGEQNDIWRAASGNKPSDFVPFSEVTSESLDAARTAFDLLLENTSSGRPVLEKTPANTLRPDLVYSVFPNAKYIHLVRDGRDVVVSALKKYQGDTRKITQNSDNSSGSIDGFLSNVRYKLSRGITVSQIISNWRHYLNSSLNQLGIKKHLWGPKFPGWSELIKSATDLEVAAYQWKMSVNITMSFLASKPELDLLTVRFENLLLEPEKVADELTQFLALEPKEDANDLQEKEISPYGWKQSLSSEQLDMVSSLIEHELQMLGYEPSHAYKHIK